MARLWHDSGESCYWLESDAMPRQTREPLQNIFLPVFISPAVQSPERLSSRFIMRLHFEVLHMNLRGYFLPVLSAVGITVFASGITVAEEIARWDFDQEHMNWEPNSEVELSLEEGHLKVHSSGKDPYLTARVDGRSGNHRITITAKFKGNTNLRFSGQRRPNLAPLKKDPSVANCVVQNKRREVSSCTSPRNHRSLRFGLTQSARRATC